MATDYEIFKGKTLSDVFKDIYDNLGYNVKYSIEVGSFRLDNDKYS